MVGQLVAYASTPNDPAQRPGPRGRWIATWTRWPGSLQRMVRRQSCFTDVIVRHTSDCWSPIRVCDRGFHRHVTMQVKSHDLRIESTHLWQVCHAKHDL